MIFYNGTANIMKMVLLLYCRAPLTLNINAILKKGIGIESEKSMQTS